MIIEMILSGFLFLFILHACVVFLVVVLIPLHIYRAWREEEALTEKLGDRYLEYRKKTIF